MSVSPRDRAGMAQLLGRVSLVVLLSEFETGSLAAREALAAGCRLLVADRAGLKELADEGWARAVELAATSDVIASAIVEELDHPREPKRLPQMSWDQCAAALLDLYHEVVSDTERADAGSGGAPATGHGGGRS